MDKNVIREYLMESTGSRAQIVKYLGEPAISIQVDTLARSIAQLANESGQTEENIWERKKDIFLA